MYKNELDRARRRSIALKVGIVAGAGAVAVPMLATPAGASKAQCASDRLCEWEDGGFNSSFRSWSPNGADSDYRNNDYSDGSGLNDSISSIFNNSGRWAKIYQDVGNAGYTLCLGPGMAISDLHTQKLDSGDFIPPIDTWGNRISGHSTSDNQPAGCDTVINDANHQGCSM